MGAFVRQHSAMAFRLRAGRNTCIRCIFRDAGRWQSTLVQTRGGARARLCQYVDAQWQSIADAMSEQGAASLDIARRVENVAQASEESNASVQHATLAVRNIQETSGRMRSTVERFKV